MGTRGSLRVYLAATPGRGLVQSAGTALGPRRRLLNWFFTPPLYTFTIAELENALALLARVRAAVRRAAPAEEAALIDVGDFTVDLAAKKVSRAGADVRLTPTEWHVLEVLVRNAGRLVSQQQLLREVWGSAYESETNYLRVYPAQLRRKLEPDPAHPRHLITEPGMGYRFEGAS